MYIYDISSLGVNLPAFRSMTVLLLENKKNLTFIFHVFTFYDCSIGAEIAQSV